jgi:hypothetical protein
MIREDRQSLPGYCDYCRVGKIFPHFTGMSGVQKLLISSVSLRSSSVVDKINGFVLATRSVKIGS